MEGKVIIIIIIIISYPVFEKSVEFELIESNYLFVNGNRLIYFRLLKQETVFRTFSKCVTDVDGLLQLSLWTKYLKKHQTLNVGFS